MLSHNYNTTTISIHALLAESDAFDGIYSDSEADISIHALLAESDGLRCGFAPRNGYFYPRSPCGERQSNLLPIPKALKFLSTLSLRRATEEFLQTRKAVSISIHALLAESDRTAPPPERKWIDYFYPRSPCGERQRIAKLYKEAADISIHALLAESDDG